MYLAAQTAREDESNVFIRAVVASATGRNQGRLQTCLTIQQACLFHQSANLSKDRHSVILEVSILPSRHLRFLQASRLSQHACRLHWPIQKVGPLQWLAEQRSITTFSGEISHKGTPFYTTRAILIPQYLLVRRRKRTFKLLNLPHRTILAKRSRGLTHFTTVAGNPFHLKNST